MIYVMECEFEMLISFRTPDGYTACGQYFLGKDILSQKNYRHITRELFRAHAIEPNHCKPQQN